MKKNCPVRNPTTEHPRRDDGKGGQPRLRPVGKGGEGKRDDGTAPSAAGPATTTTQSTSTSSAGTSASASMDSTSGGPGTAEAPTSIRDVDDFLKNATQVLKMMAEQHTSSRPGPSMKMLKKVIKDYEGKMALVDSGATHPLKTASSTEWAKADEVDVVVAGDGVKRMRQSTAGTEPEAKGAQTILPLGSLVSVLGYDLVWTKKKCILRAPDGKELALRVTSGCPEVSETTALELIAKIEQEKVARLDQSTQATKQAIARARAVQLDPLWEKSLQQYVATGGFEDGFRAMASSPWATDELHGELAKIITDLPTAERQAWELMQQLGFKPQNA